MIKDIKSLLRKIHKRKLKKAQTGPTPPPCQQSGDDFTSKVLNFNKTVNKEAEIPCLYDTFNPVEVKEWIDAEDIKIKAISQDSPKKIEE